MLEIIKHIKDTNFKIYKYYSLKFLLLFCHIYLIPTSYAYEKLDIPLKFIAYLGGLQIGEANGNFAIDKDNYVFEYNAKVTGILSLIYDWTQNLKVNGKIVDSNLQLEPEYYYTSDIRGKKTGHMEISYNNSLVKVISAQPDPKDDDRRNFIPIKLRKNTFDPASAFLFRIAIKIDFLIIHFCFKDIMTMKDIPNQSLYKITMK